MKLCKRTFALLLILCMVIPMCLISVSASGTANTNEPDIKLYTSLDNLISTNFSGKVNFMRWVELWKNGTVDVLPLTHKGNAGNIRNDHKVNEKWLPSWTGLYSAATAGNCFIAFMIHNPGDGAFRMSLEYTKVSNMATQVDIYAIPQNADTMKSLYNNYAFDMVDNDEIEICQTAAQAAILNEIDSANTNSFATKIGSVDLSAGESYSDNEVTVGTLNSKVSDGDYIIVLVPVKDATGGEGGRANMFLKGLNLNAGTGSSGSTTPTTPSGDTPVFYPVDGELAAKDIIKVADFYRATVGINPTNGHDLLYLLFKGYTLLVYDLDAKQMIDNERIVTSAPYGVVVDENNNLWFCGSGATIQKYDPRIGELSNYVFDYALFDGVKTSAFGLTSDGNGNLYFGYWGWIGKLNTVTGEFSNVSGKQLSIDDKDSDGQFTAFGGMVYQDGYLYLCIHGDLNKDKIITDQILKYDIAAQKIVDYVNISDSAYKSSYGVTDLKLVDDLLIGTFSDRQIPVYIDISGEKMERIEEIEGVPDCLIGGISDPIDGKVYAAGYVDATEITKCIYEYDPETRTAKRIGSMLYINSLKAGGGVCTIEGEAGLNGQVVVTAYNNSATGMVDAVFYNPATGETVIWEGITDGYGTSASLRELITDPTGRYVYTGAYGTNRLGIYDLLTGETINMVTHSHQIDSLICYDGFLWAGNYNLGSVTKVDLQTGDVTPLFNLMETVFQQKRMFSLAAGNGKVFCGTVPDTGRTGGILGWYDIETDLTYIAAGPNPEDVYYAKTTASFVVWRNVVTDEIEDFDEDGDGQYDFDFIIDDKGDEDPSNDVKEQRFYGVIPNQCINDMLYKDGYIIGTTTKANGQNVGVTFYDGNAQLFVYDVSAMKLVATYDIAKDISDLNDPDNACIPYLDGIAEDPYEPGKFWGTVADTLYSFTIDFDTMTFNVKEELSFGKGDTYRHPSSTWHARSIVFEGDYLYAAFHNYGTFMVNTSDPTDCTQVAEFPTSRMALAADGNLYYFSNSDQKSLSSICVLKIADKSQPLVAQSVQKLIDSLPVTVTVENEAQIINLLAMYNDLIDSTKAMVNAEKLNAAASALEVQQAAKADALIDAIGKVTKKSGGAIAAARSYYDSLPDGAKAKVTKLSVLEAAEAKLAKLLNGGNTTVIVIVAVAAVVLIAGAATALVVIRKKKYSLEETGTADRADEEDPQ